MQRRKRRKIERRGIRTCWGWQTETNISFCVFLYLWENECGSRPINLNRNGEKKKGKENVVFLKLPSRNRLTRYICIETKGGYYKEWVFCFS